VQADSSTVGDPRPGLIAPRSEATRRQSSDTEIAARILEQDPDFLFGGLGLVDYCRKAEGYRLSCHRSRARGDCSQTPSRWRANLRRAHRRRIVATAFRTSSTAPRIKAITRTTAVAMQTARMSFSIAVRSCSPALRSGSGPPKCRRRRSRTIMTQDCEASCTARICRTALEHPLSSQPSVGREQQRQSCRTTSKRK